MKVVGVSTGVTGLVDLYARVTCECVILRHGQYPENWEAGIREDGEPWFMTCDILPIYSSTSKPQQSLQTNLGHRHMGVWLFACMRGMCRAACHSPGKNMPVVPG